MSGLFNLMATRRPPARLAESTSGRAVPRLPLRTQRAQPCCASDSGPMQSYDSEDEPDRKLSDELAQLKDPNRLQRAASNFELAWKISSAAKMPSQAEPCQCCEGSGETECNFCHGTGFLTIGDTLVMSVATHSSHCPVCKGTGYVKCEPCRATGFRAKWIPPPPPPPAKDPALPS